MLSAEWAPQGVLRLNLPNPRMSLLKISGGTVYDPTNHVDGLVRDVWIDEGRIVSAPTDPAVRPARVIDARTSPST